MNGSPTIYNLPTQPIVFSNKITVLLVDDQPMVAEAIKNMLEGEKDIAFHYCQDPTKALQMASEVKPTVILQDLVMPNIDGLTMVKFFRANPVTKEVPMIVLSSREEPHIKSQAFSLGANDYIVKLPDKLEVIARIRYHSKAYINLIERNQAYQALLESQRALKAELKEAARYVKSLLPALVNDSVLSTDWAFITSTDLGGDAFGYHWINEDFFAIYLLDVCGHGVGAALLSVSAMNVLRSQTLPSVDFTEPDAVLAGLNETFDMDKQNKMYFTMWYGVYNKKARTLTYTSGGHPPAILIPKNMKSPEPIQLKTAGMVIGGMPGITFASQTVSVEPGDILYVFSDGVYEVNYKNKPRMMTVDEFAKELAAKNTTNLSKVQSMVSFARTAQGKDSFEDDFSLLEICFK